MVQITSYRVELCLQTQNPHPAAFQSVRMSHYTEQDRSSAPTLGDSSACDPNNVATPPESATVSPVHLVQQRKASAVSLRHRPRILVLTPDLRAIADVMRQTPQCVWIKNKTSANIVIKVSKTIPSRLLTELEIGLSVEGGGTIGGEAAVSDRVQGLHSLHIYTFSCVRYQRYWLPSARTTRNVSRSGLGDKLK